MLDGSIIKVHQDAMRSCYDKAAEAIRSSNVPHWIDVCEYIISFKVEHS